MQIIYSTKLRTKIFDDSSTHRITVVTATTRSPRPTTYSPTATSSTTNATHERLPCRRSQPVLTSPRPCRRHVTDGHARNHANNVIPKKGLQQNIVLLF